MVSVSAELPAPAITPIKLSTEINSSQQNGHAAANGTAGAYDAASKVPTANGTAPHIESEVSSGDIATDSHPSEDIEEVHASEGTSSAKADASGRPIPEQWKKR